MKTSLIRAGALSCALLASTALCSPALAVTPAAAPPVQQSVDGNGVDMATGAFAVSAPALSIGPSGPQGLVYSRVLNGAGWRDSLTATMSHDSLGRIVVSIAGSSDRFTQSGSTYTATEGNGATLTYNGALYTYTSRDGTVAVFTPASGQYDRFVADIGWIRDITFPNGVKWTYTYQGVNYCPHELDAEIRTCSEPLARSVRLQSVTTNSGYQLKLGYQGNTLTHVGQLEAWQNLTKVTGINNAVEYCNPSTSSCTLTGSWPSVTYTHIANGNGWDETETDATGAVTRYTIDGQYRVTAMRRPTATSNDVTVGYTGDKVTSITRAGVSYAYSWSDSGNTRTMTMTGPLSAQVVATSDIDTSLVRTLTDALNRTTSYDYDSSHRLQKVTYPEGNYVTYSYDARGNATQVLAHAKPGTSEPDIVTSASFDASCANQKTCNQPNSTTDARGNVTDYTYDSSHGGVLTVTLPAPSSGAVRPQTRYAYTPLQAYYKNSAGSIVASGQNITLPTSTSTCQTGSSCAGTADEVKTIVSYGPQTAGTANNLLPASVSSGAGDNSLTAASAFTWDNVGNRLTVDGPLSGTADTSRTRYDAMRRVVGTVSPDPDGAGTLKPRAQRITYNGDGDVTKAEAGNVNSQSDADWAAFTAAEAVETGFDANGRPVTSALTSGGTIYALVQTGYDALGRPECTAQRMNPAVFATVASTTGACSLGTQGSFGPDRIVRTSYDVAGQVTKTTSAYGVSGEQADDATTGYTGNGLVQTVTDAENNKTTYVYDGQDRLSKTLFPSPTKGAGTSSTTDYELTTYESLAGGTRTSGLAVSFRNRAGETIALSYDALGRLTLKDLPGSEPDVSYGYDNLSRPTSASQTGHALSFTWDALSRKRTETGPLGTVTSAWDVGGRRTRLTHPDGFFVDYDYLVTGEVDKIRENGATSGAGVLATFGYDDPGRRTSLTRGNGTVTSYAYDAVSRLQTLSQNLAGTAHDLTMGFSYSPSSQIAASTRSNDAYSFSRANAFQGTREAPGSYGVNGLNQVSSHSAGTPTYDAKGNMTWDGVGTKTYSYSSENLLTGAGGTRFLRYDPLMRLAEGGSSTSTKNVYDGSDRIAQYNSSGTLVARFVYGPGTDERLVTYAGTGLADRYWVQADERQSDIAFSDASGAAAGLVQYDENGMFSATFVNPAFTALHVAFTGQFYDTVSDLYYYKARMYHPWLGRFMQSDPIRYGDGMNIYAYVGGDPVNRSDPSGLRDGWLDNRHVIRINPNEAPTDPEIVVTGSRRRVCEACKSSGLPPETILELENSFRTGSWNTETGIVECNTDACAYYPDVTITGKKPSLAVGRIGAISKPVPERRKEDEYACLKAVAGGAISTALDPISLVATGTAGVVTSARAIGKAAYPVGRALTLGVRALPGFAIATGVAAALGGLKAYLTDPRCR